MLIYSTVSPYYFDYLASCRTRQEILDDPELCHFLEDPALKDNMEVALAYNDAKKGGYNEKKQFVEYLLCNGPELDADTICYYREKAYQDPIYIQIAEIEFNDMTLVDQLRVDKYGKSNDLGDCFTKPCNYLGPFSNVIGLMGDANNFRTMPNIFSTLLNGKEENKTDLSACWGNIRQHMMNKMFPNIQIACQSLYNCMYDHMKAFADQCKSAGLTDGINIGDKYSIGRADEISAATKINVHSQLGDCARVWEHMRRFNPYDISQNKKTPMPDSAMVDNRAANGASIDNTTVPNPMTQVPDDKVREAAAKGNKEAEYELAIRNMTYPYTLADIQYIADTNRPLADRVKYIQNKRNDAIVRGMPTYETQKQEYIAKFGNNSTAMDVLNALDAKNTKAKNNFIEIAKGVQEANQDAIEMAKTQREISMITGKVNSPAGVPDGAEEEEEIIMPDDQAVSMSPDKNEEETEED